MKLLKFIRTRNKRKLVFIGLFIAVLILLATAGVVGAKKGWLKYFADEAIEPKSLVVYTLDKTTNKPIPALISVAVMDSSGKLKVVDSGKSNPADGKIIFRNLNPGEYYLSHLPCNDQIYQKVNVPDKGTEYRYLIDSEVDCTCEWYNGTDSEFCSADGGIKIYLQLGHFTNGIKVYMTDAGNKILEQIETATLTGDRYNGLFDGADGKGYPPGNYRFYFNRAPTSETASNPNFSVKNGDYKVVDQYHGLKKFEIFETLDQISEARVNVEGVVTKGANLNCGETTGAGVGAPVDGAIVKLKSKANGKEYVTVTGKKGEPAPGPTQNQYGPTTKDGHSFSEVSSSTAEGGVMRTGTSWFGRHTDPATGEEYAEGTPWKDPINNGESAWGGYKIPDGGHLDDPEDYYAAVRGGDWWHGQKPMVYNPENGRAVIVKIIDKGPLESLKRDIDLSYAAFHYLELKEDVVPVMVTFAETTKEDGYYSIKNIPRDLYDLAFSKIGFATTLVGDLDLRSVKDKSTTKKDGVIYELKNENQTFIGKVKNDKGKPIPNVALRLYSSDKKTQIAAGVSDEKGEYKITTKNVVGTLTMKVVYETEDAKYEFWYSNAGSEQISPPAACGQMGINDIIIAAEVRAKIIGQVKDEATGKPLSPVRITVTADDGSETKSKLTASDGKYSISVLGNKDYTVSAKYCGSDKTNCQPPLEEMYTEAIETVYVKAGLEVTVNFQLMPNPGKFAGRVWGYVYNADDGNKPLPSDQLGNPTVFLIKENSGKYNTVGSSRTDEKGKYNIDLDLSTPKIELTGSNKYKVCVRDFRFLREVDHPKAEEWKTTFSGTAGISNQIRQMRFNQCSDISLPKHNLVVRRKDFRLSVADAKKPSAEEYELDLRYQLVDFEGKPLAPDEIVLDENGNPVAHRGSLKGVKAKLSYPASMPDGESGSEVSNWGETGSDGKTKIISIGPNPGVKIGDPTGLTKTGEVDIKYQNKKIIVTVKVIGERSGVCGTKNEADRYFMSQRDRRWAGDDKKPIDFDTNIGKNGCAITSFSMAANLLMNNPYFITPDRFIHSNLARRGYGYLQHLQGHFKAATGTEIKQAATLHEMMAGVNKSHIGVIHSFGVGGHNGEEGHAVLVTRMSSEGNGYWRIQGIDPNPPDDGPADPKNGYYNIRFHESRFNKAYYVESVPLSTVNLSQGVCNTGQNCQIAGAISNSTFQSCRVVKITSEPITHLPMLPKAYAADQQTTNYQMPVAVDEKGNFKLNIPAFMINPSIKATLVEEHILWADDEYPLNIKVSGSASSLSIIDQLRIKRSEVEYAIANSVPIKLIKSLTNKINNWVRRNFMLATNQGLFSAVVSDANGDQIRNVKVSIDETKIKNRQGFFVQKFSSGKHQVSITDSSGRLLYQKNSLPGGIYREVEIKRGEDNYFKLQLNETLEQKDVAKAWLNVIATDSTGKQLPNIMPLTIRIWENGPKPGTYSGYKDQVYYTDNTGYLFVEGDFAGKRVDVVSSCAVAGYNNSVNFDVKPSSKNITVKINPTGCFASTHGQVRVAGKLAKVKVVVIAGDNQIVSNGESQENGYFRFDNLYFPSDYKMIFQSLDGKIVYKPANGLALRINTASDTDSTHTKTYDATE